ncbi:hypothetical protein PCC9214_00456 [Planktothrix tepida]|uniref:Uncharacterized protein n=1 Tax=Planktothrix pseudagardhii TaxID=132604 RepID=A0A9W4CYU4_9CYAN|nr:hypothetical protein PCC9214_00456 [Planktothrix tepida]CAD5985035.1 hypothetical protein NO713_05346 [Planktothrix pseudagardhii]
MMRERFHECSLAALELKRLAAQSNDSSDDNCCTNSQGECQCLSCCCLDRESQQKCYNDNDDCCKDCSNTLDSPEFWERTREILDKNCSSPQKISKCTLSCCTFGISDICCYSSELKI